MAVDLETIIRRNITVATTRGQLTPQQLWAMPVESRDGFSLEAIINDLGAQLEAAGAKKTYVRKREKAVDPNANLKLMFDLVEHIIETKEKEADAKSNAAANASERKRLDEIIARKQSAELENLTIEQLIARRDQIGQAPAAQ